MTSFRTISTEYIAWVSKHQAPRTHEYYSEYITSFLQHLASVADEPASAMKPFQVEEWVDSHDTWGDTHRRNGIVAINRVYNWATKNGKLDNNPIKTAFKPPAGRRKSYATPEDFTKILSHVDVTDPFHDMLIFAWTTGCRPQELRHIEARHVNLEKGYILFPKEESKGKRVARKIILNDVALEIIKHLVEKNPDGKLFRNSWGTAWTKGTLGNRMQTLSKLTGKRLAMYDLRHGFGTRKLKDGHGHLQIAACMGHTDGSMLAKIYSHVDEDDEHLRTVLVD